MPYEGYGPMYECPHYCPVHLFSASSPPEISTKEPLSVALVDALKRKFGRLDAELKEQAAKNSEKTSTHCSRPASQGKFVFKKRVK